MDHFISWQLDNPEVVAAIALIIVTILHLPLWLGWLED